MKKQVYVSKRSDLSLIGSAFEAAGFRCVRIRTECEVEHRTKGGDSRRRSGDSRNHPKQKHIRGAQVSPSKPTHKPKGLLMKLTR